MLNISFERINDRVDSNKYNTFKLLNTKNHKAILIRLITALSLLGLVTLFLPWTQNIRSKAYVTTLEPNNKPQNIQALIGGKIEKWYVTEGQLVQKGDTILKLTEVKEEYMDPELLPRTQNQIDAKSGSVSAYEIKIQNLRDQVRALEDGLVAKLKQNEIKATQLRLKIQADSSELVAVRIQLTVAEKQLNRIESLYNDGIKSLTDLEEKKLKYQESVAKTIALENKINAQRNELESISVYNDVLLNDYSEKIAKTKSEINSTQSVQYEAVGNINKLQSQYNSYSVRADNYFVLSPITGTLMETIPSGIGEILKNGDKIGKIIPAEYKMAVEMYVIPEDVALLDIGQKVMIQFDGWPSIVFSGWPNNSYGTYTGKVAAVDNFISSNGKYKVLVSPDPDAAPWPEQLRLGAGANTITLLKNVNVGYEIWRKLNGFPPDYYKLEEPEDLKLKAPLKSVK